MDVVGIVEGGDGWGVVNCVVEFGEYGDDDVVLVVGVGVVVVFID